MHLAAFLIHTPQGHILIDGGMPSTAPIIETSINELGFKPEDIRILLTTQAHYDHVGSHAHFTKLSGAMVPAMDGDGYRQMVSSRRKQFEDLVRSPAELGSQHQR